MAITHYWVLRRGYGRLRTTRASLAEVARGAWSAAPVLLIPAVVVVGLVGGVVTPTEAGVLACAGALILSVVVYRELTLKGFAEAVKRAARTTTVIWAVIAASNVFSELLVRNLFAERLIEGVSAVASSATGVLLVITGMVFLLGMFIDTTPLLIMMAQPLHEAGMAAGVDPVHLGVVLVTAALIGTVSPPVSLLLCLNCGIAGIPLSATFRVIWSYLAVMLGVVVLCILVPGFVTWLPAQGWFE